MRCLPSLVLLIAVTLFSGALLLTGCGEEPAGVEETEDGALELGREAVQTTEQRTVAPLERTLELNGLRGTIILHAEDTNNASWAFTKTARGRDAEHAQRVLDRLTIEERGTEDRYTFALDSGTPAQSRVDIEGTLPESTPLVLRRSSGIVHVDGMHGALDVEQTHGSVRVRNGQGNVRIRVDNGMLDLDFASLAPNARVDVTTKNGHVHISIPHDASAQLDVETTSGRVFSHGLSYEERELRVSEAGYHFEGRIGDGEATIRARTEHGDIRLMQRTKSEDDEAPSADTLRESPPTMPDLVDPDDLINEPADTLNQSSSDT